MHRRNARCKCKGRDQTVHQPRCTILSYTMELYYDTVSLYQPSESQIGWTLMVTMIDPPFSSLIKHLEPQASMLSNAISLNSKVTQAKKSLLFAPETWAITRTIRGWGQFGQIQPNQTQERGREAEVLEEEIRERESCV